MQTRTEGEALVVALIGSADLAGTERLERALTVLCAQRPNRVVFDLSNLASISSLCIGMLITCHRAITSWHGTFVLAGANETVAAALRRCRLDDVFTMTPTVGTALDDAR